MKTTLRFDSAGKVDCLYTDAIDLRALGKLSITRATDIRFNAATQQWDVFAAAGNSEQVLYSHASRSQCLDWENQNLQPQ